ncbi:Carboxypeptidase regulatory-like domain-containing protein [Granulicella rosea]|uniref:Carboxypeptidase regulatory-like domain-containing protein n=1 Tax=Granulicella rosea TaxID=474952 RepID=A0A239M5H6_9BACT|nr:TonB-dependent receptor [Granulicella rosea]SNT37975.1 Carboxypeptidase regulatory-like domain-containing protein [Granulicella rosea]
MGRLSRCLQLWLLLACGSGAGFASEYHGQIVFGDSPVPGATVTATRGATKIAVVSDQLGLYSFADLPDGAWTIEVEMLCFAPVKQEVTISSTTAAGRWELKLLPLAEIIAKANAPKPAAPALIARADIAKKDDALPDAPRPPDDSAPRPADGLLIQGSSNNAATSQYTLNAAFGNNRTSKSLYTGGVSLVFDNSVFDARPYSLTGLNTPKDQNNHITGGLTFGGPLNIPHLMKKGPSLFLTYQWMRNRNATTQSGLVPTDTQRDAVNAGGVPTAKSLLSFYPLPNLTAGGRYNYQTQTIGNEHQDAVTLRLDRTIGRRDSVYGGFALQSTRTDAANLFGFVDTTDLLGINTTANWSHHYRQFYNVAGFRFSRLRTHVTPQFESRRNVSGAAGISADPAPAGNDQDPLNWGPPTLVFASGIASLSDAQSSRNRNQTDAVSDSVTWTYRRHNLTVGGDLRRQETNIFAQEDPRGTYTFTGAYALAASAAPNGAAPSGADFEDFLLGTPDTSSIAFGNPDKYLRQTVYDAYVADDWRVRSELTLNFGLRYDYGAPVTETKGRLVNLDVSPGFTAVAPVLGSSPAGTLTGQRYPTSLIRPDRLGIEPRIGLSWRPIPASTLVIRAGYGVYDDTSVYTAQATLMAQQAPLSKSVSESYNATTCSITLANGFLQCPTTTADTFAVDPNFRVGYAQTWNLSAQRDLPGALVATASYLGIKGTRGIQEYLPNSYPLGGVNPCPSCPSGFVYRGSNGNSTRESAQLQLRRRLRSGFAASLQYTYSKSIDDDSTLGGQGPVAPGAAVQAQPSAVVAQDWRNLSAERGLSTFDQRHLLNVQLQYTSGMGKGGGTLMSGWRGSLLKEWTVLSQINTGTGLPETPIYLAATPGTGVTGAIRPSLTGASIHNAPVGYHLNSAAYTAPTPGQWGNAGRDSITGPAQFTLTASLQRTFRMRDHLNLDLRVDSTNLLNHVVFTSWNTIVNGTTFGLPASTNAMRSLQTTVRVRY